MSGIVRPNFDVDLSRSIGPPLAGAFLATAFWGMTCNQAIMYFVTYELDPWYLKGLVILLWLLNTVHEALCINGLWQTLIPRFGDLARISILQPDFVWQALIASIVAFFARGFFTWRIWRFANKNWIFPILLVPPSIGDTAATFVWAFRGVKKPPAVLISGGMFKLSLAITIIIAATDILIAVTMCVLLWRSRTGFPATNKLILRLMNASVNTGAWTAVFGIFSTITLVAWPHDLFALLLQFPICALYCNAVLANLNSRRYIRGTDRVVDFFYGGDDTEPSVKFALSSSSRSEARPDTLEMKVKQSSVEEPDLHNDNPDVSKNSTSSPENGSVDATKSVAQSSST